MLRRLLLATAFLPVAWGLGYSEPESEVPSFGFSGAEFYKLDWDTHNLRIADVNSDGLNDIVVFNNARARIECLIQQTDLDVKIPSISTEPNEFPNDTRFRNFPFLAEKKLFSLELGDLNGDGRDDMVYYGDPRELVVVYQNAAGAWGITKTFDISDGSTKQAALAIGDINSDDRNDIVLMARDGVYFILQNPLGKLSAPVKETGLPEGATAIALRDFNGSSRLDLLYACANEATPICFRFQSPEGHLGPEVPCKTPAVRTLTLGDFDKDGVEEIAVVQQHSGRLVLYKLAFEASNADGLDGPFDRYTLRATTSGRSPVLTFAGFSSIDRKDILVTNPDAAEIELFVQKDIPAQWQKVGSFPFLRGTKDIAVLPETSLHRLRLLALSPEEPMLGISSMDNKGRLTFPRALPIVGTPACMTTGDLDLDGIPEIIYATSFAGKYSVRILSGDISHETEEVHAIPLEMVPTPPSGLLVADANQDGLKDILLFTPYQEMRILKRLSDATFEDVSRGQNYGKGLVQNASLRTVDLVDVDGDGKLEILLAVKNVARALRLDDQDRIQIVDQFNGRSSTSQIVAVAGADMNGDGIPEIALADSSNRCLTLLRRNHAGMYQIASNTQTGPLNLERLIITDMSGDGLPEVMLLTKTDFTVLRPGASYAKLKQVASYNTPVENGRLDGLAFGDLNNDGKVDVLVTEATKHAMEFLQKDDNQLELKRVLSWLVFEGRASDRANRGVGASIRSEPREFEIADIDGDGKEDIVLLVHDRLMVCPQE